MTRLNLITMINAPSAPYWFVLVAIILVGIGVGFWIHFGAGIAATGVALGAFGILLGSD